ncbi:MAG TPA: hypothetical protein VF658_16360 [Pyrinomonadaceae bacterium]|jgi:hypothetical protein
MGYKKQRLVTKLLHAARSEERYRDTHVFIGGTGAVGGTALLQMLSMYEEMMSIQSPKADDVPILMTTGVGREDIAAFTARLFRFVQSRHGESQLPRKQGPNYLTHSGIFVGLERFQLTALPGLENLRKQPVAKRPEFVRNFLSTLGNKGNDYDRLMQAISEARPMSTFLKHYRGKLPPDRRSSRFRSVVIGIPIPSLVAYHFDYLKEASPYIEGLTDDKLKELVSAFRQTLSDDLNEIQTSLSDLVLLAHTTAIGGMYDEDSSNGRLVKTFRLGFSHSAQDDKLVIKQEEAEEFARKFSLIGIKVLITAAAIGIDEVRIRQKIPLHKQITEKLWDEPQDLFPGAKKMQTLGVKKGEEEVGSQVQVRQFISIYRPQTILLDAQPSGPVTFEKGETLLPTYSIRSGENGFFSVSNADALYRVMRVASASELGQIVATVGLFGDDPLSPWFPDNRCYYTEGDNSRQVFDLINQPPLLQMQLSGLEPMALQDLGSAKHQGELHTLSLLILLHRLRTLDMDAIDPYVDLNNFDPARFLMEHSKPLTFEDLANWQFDTIVKEMRILASAEEPQELAELNPSRYSGLFKSKDKAIHQVLKRVLKAVWMIPSLGSPILFERDGKTFIRTGYFVAPLAHLVKDMTLVNDLSMIDQYLKRGYEEHARERREEGENPCAFEDYRDFNICAGGFVDLRPTAILCTAKNSHTTLTGKIKRCADEQSLRNALLDLEPYSFFTTCGLVALLFRLRGLYNQLREAMAELGTLHEFRWQMPRDANGHILVVPGAIEAFRMVAEGLEKTTGTERLDGIWGYERRKPPERWDEIPGINS